MPEKEPTKVPELIIDELEEAFYNLPINDIKFNRKMSSFLIYSVFNNHTDPESLSIISETEYINYLRAKKIEKTLCHLKDMLDVAIERNETKKVAIYSYSIDVQLQILIRMANNEDNDTATEVLVKNNYDILCLEQDQCVGLSEEQILETLKRNKAEIESMDNF